MDAAYIVQTVVSCIKTSQIYCIQVYSCTDNRARETAMAWAGKCRQRSQPMAMLMHTWPWTFSSTPGRGESGYHEVVVRSSLAGKRTSPRCVLDESELPSQMRTTSVEVGKTFALQHASVRECTPAHAHD